MVLSTLVRLATFTPLEIELPPLPPLSLRVMVPPPVRMAPAAPMTSLVEAPWLFKAILPLLTIVPPAAKVAPFSTRIEPALAPAPVPVVAVKVPPMMARVAVAAVRRLLTVALAVATTV